jgi:hypothetical protein
MMRFTPAEMPASIQIFSVERRGLDRGDDDVFLVEGGG